MPRNSNPDTSKMVEYKKFESETKKNAVLAVLRELTLLDDPINSPITKAEICRGAGVSKTFLYSYPEDLLKPINQAMKYQNEKARVVFQKQTFSNNSKDRLMESLKRNIKALEEENRKLRNDRALLLGKFAKIQVSDPFSKYGF